MLKKLQEEYNKDIKINPGNIQYEAANNPVLYSKWLNIYSDTKHAILAAELKKRKILKDRLDFYTGRGDQACMTLYEKSEMKTVIQADEEILKIDASIELNGIILDYLSKCIDNIKSRGFAIKNIIEIRKFENGV